MIRRSLAPWVIALLLVALAPGPVAEAGPQESTYLVTLRADAKASDVAARTGADLLPIASEVSVVRATSAAAAKLSSDRGVASVEPDGLVRALGAGWDGASWDGASWDGASWDGASWDGASWDGASWDGASWDGASWDGASDGTSWDGTSWDGASWDGTSWDGTSWDGTSWDGRWDARGLPPPPWGILAINAPAAWRADVPANARTVCMVDSGVDASHPALRGAVVAGFDAMGEGAALTDPAGHGTHLAGIVAASRATPSPGVSQANIASARALGPDGVGTTADVIEAIGWCERQDYDIVLLALTEDAPTKAFEKAVASAQRAGALVIAAAGNRGPCEGCVSSPGSLPHVLTVAAYRPDLETAAFSSSGPQVDVAGPGVHITSAVPGGWRTASGTSQAAAFAAGAAALAWSECSTWSSKDVARSLAPAGRGVPRLDIGWLGQGCGGK